MKIKEGDSRRNSAKKAPTDSPTASLFAALYRALDRAKCENRTKSIQPMHRIHLSVFIRRSLVDQTYHSRSLLQAGRARFPKLPFNRLVHLSVVSLWSQFAIGQNDYARSTDVSRYDGPLPEWSIVAGALLGGLALWLMGRLLIKASTTLDEKGKGGGASTSIGCLGVVCGWAAFACLIPLLMWAERIGLVLLFVVAVAVVLLVIMGWLRTWLKKR